MISKAGEEDIFFGKQLLQSGIHERDLLWPIP